MHRTTYLVLSSFALLAFFVGILIWLSRLEQRTAECSKLCSVAAEGNKKAVQELLAVGADPNCSIGKSTPLHAARNYGHPDVIQLLKQAGAKD